MYKFFEIIFNKKLSIDYAWELCLHSGVNNLYSIEDATNHYLYGEFPEKRDLEKLLNHPSLISIKELEPPQIDWEAQWESFGSNYFKGVLHIDLEKTYALCGSFILKPGPGFGDLSHPTTSLMIELMGPHVAGKNICDIGCGSGILSIAAIRLGANKVDAIDIDIKALEHAQSNAELNEMTAHIAFYLPKNFHATDSEFILMNMLPVEQLIAWEMLPSLHKNQSQIIVSGILENLKSGYIQESRKKGWQLLEEKTKDCWTAMRFSRQVQKS